MLDDLKARYIAGLSLEPERLRILGGPAYDFALNRRELLQSLGAGLLLAFAVRAENAAGAVDELKANVVPARLHISEDGLVTLLTGKVEIGQGSRTELTQVVAEELRLPLARVRIVMGDTSLVPDDGGTWGSLTTPQTVPAVRKAAATARELLLEAAAERLACNVGVLQMENGRIHHPSETSLSLAELAREDALLGRTMPPRPTEIPPAEWTVCGTSAPAVNGRDIVTGSFRYASDLKIPGTLTGKVIRPAAHKATLVSFDAKAAEQMPGVRVVRDGNFLGVVAASEQEAEAAAQKVQATWDEILLPNPADLAAQFRQSATAPQAVAGARYPALLQRGDPQPLLQADRATQKTVYTLPYIAHVPLEPRAVIAQWHGDRLTVRCGTQAPFLVRKELAEAFRIPEANVRVIAFDTGSGFGGKQRAESEIETARLAKSVNAPVRLAWTRSEEFTCAYSRPAGLIEVQSALDKQGKLAAWDFRNYNSGAASLGAPYEIPHLYCGFFRTEAPLRQGSYRSLAGVANTFAREAHMDELAVIAQMDPLDFRLGNLTDLRLKTVAERAGERFGWGKRKAGAGVGFGLAINLEKDARLALFTEVETGGGNARVRRMVIAFEGGAILNPGNLENQIQGALIHGLGGALFEELIWDRQGIRNGKLSTYRVPRFADVPEIEVLLIDRRDLASAGAGESPITVVAPSIANAIFSASGQRLHSLPLLSAWRASTA